MLIEIVPADGVGRQRPLRLYINQIVIRQDNGTPILVAAELADNSQVFSKFDDEDFNRRLRQFGIVTEVTYDTLQLPKPAPTARLIAGPKGV